MIDKKYFEKAIADILSKEKPGREAIASSTISFLEKYSVPKELQKLLSENSFDRSSRIGHIYYNKVNDLEKENIKEGNINCINEGLLIVGYSATGDPIVIDTKTLTMGFVFHHELQNDTSIKARSIYIDTGMTFGQFYFNAISKLNEFPKDAGSAKEIFG